MSPRENFSNDGYLICLDLLKMKILIIDELNKKYRAK